MPHDQNYLGTFPESSDGAIEQKPVLKRPASTQNALGPAKKKNYSLRPRTGGNSNAYIVLEDTTDQQAEGSGSIPVDEKSYKAAIRRINNRLAAKASRERKVAKLNQLEQENQEIQKKNSLLTSQNAAQEEKIARLELENRYLKQILAGWSADSAPLSSVKSPLLRLDDPWLPVDPGLISDDES